VADIFLSYAREDLAWASRLATALAGCGWSVFWDRRIPIGRSFDQVIEKELDAARCVIVLWSPHAIASHWVRAEAREGARREILHPVWVADVKVPLEFRALQSARLVDWQPGVQHTEFDQLLADITATLRPAQVSTPAPEPVKPSGSTRWWLASGSEVITRLAREKGIPESLIRLTGLGPRAPSAPLRATIPQKLREQTTQTPRWSVIGSIAAAVVLPVTIAVVMTFIRQDAPQTLTTDRGPAPTASVATTKAKDDPDALHNKGLQYAEGRGVGRDYGKAAKMFRQAAEAGHAAAQTYLGFLYDKGQGVPKDEAEAAKWYRRAADQGNVAAQFNLGVSYENGEGVPKDEAKAVKWYRKAADQGFANAQINLGRMYAYGLGVPKDDAEAVKWYRKAADQGDAQGQFAVGIMYANGEGVPKDDAEAVKWFQKAAQQGDKYAQDNLKKRGLSW
jgi:TPR repeat protein